MRRILCKYKARSLIVIVNVNCYEPSAQCFACRCRLQRTHKNWNDTFLANALSTLQMNNNNKKENKSKWHQTLFRRPAKILTWIYLFHRQKQRQPSLTLSWRRRNGQSLLWTCRKKLLIEVWIKMRKTLKMRTQIVFSASSNYFLASNEFR